MLKRGRAIKASVLVAYVRKIGDSALHPVARNGAGGKLGAEPYRCTHWTIERRRRER